MATQTAGDADATLLRSVPRPLALASDVYNAVLDRIMCLQIPPGSKIILDALARELGVSHTPIREALSRLEAEGLVLKTHLVGYSAAPQLSREQVEHLFELRLLIEPAGAGKAAGRVNDEEKKILTDLQAGMRDLMSSHYPGYAEFARKDSEFHSVIARASGNPLLSDALSKLHTHVHIFRLIFNSRVTSEAIKEHDEVLDALVTGNKSKSEKAMKNHILASRSRILSLLRA